MAVASPSVERVQGEPGQGGSGVARVAPIPAVLAPQKSFGHWLQLVKNRDSNRLASLYGSEYRTVEKAALTESTGTTGGYLIPVEWSDRLLESLDEWSFMRRLATVQPMGSRTIQLPMPDCTTAQAAGTPAYFGGVSLVWEAAGDALITETEPTFKMLELTNYPLAGYTVCSNQLVADGGKPLETFLFNLFGRAIAWYEELAFLTGNGAGKPEGIRDCPGALTITRATGSHVGTVDLAKMAGKLLPRSWSDRDGKPLAVWAMHPTALVDLFQITVGAGNSGTWQTNEPGADKRLGAPFGFPIYVTEKASVIGSRGDVMLFDPTLYVIGDRAEFLIEASDQEPTKYLKNQTIWRVICRVAGRPWIDAPVTLQDGTQTASPYVILV